ncbi:MAG: hypothetical protein ABJM26_08600 [Anderseniella sp.]
MAFLDPLYPMRAGTPDTSLLSKLLRERISASRKSPAAGPDATNEALPEHIEQRSSAVIGALMRDTRDAFDRQHPTQTIAQAAAPEPAPAPPAQTAIDASDPRDLSAFVLDTLNNCEWPDWISARCDFPDKGPFVAPGCEAALAAIAALTRQVFADAGEDGDDLTVRIFAGSASGSVRITVSGPFGLSMKTLKLIMQSRSEIEAIGGALITVRASNTAGFEALIPEQ